MTVLSALSFKSSSVTAEAKQPVEIVSLRSECGKYFDNGDGSITGFVGTSSLHYLDNNEWKVIDNTLILDENGYFKNKCNSTKVSIPSTIDVSSSDNKQNNSFTLSYDDHSMSMNIIDNNFSYRNSDSYLLEAEVVDLETSKSAYNDDLIAELVNGSCTLSSMLEYKAPDDDYMVDLTITSDSLMESLIFNAPINSTNLTYNISAEDLTAIKSDDNSIQLIDEYSNTIFRIPQIYLEDSSDIPNFKEVSTELTPINDGYILNLSLDGEWLNSNINYPVRMISEVTTNVNASTFYVSDSNPTGNYVNNYLLIGGSDTDTTNRESIIYSPTLIPSPTDMTAVKEAKLCLYMLNNNYPGSNEEIEVCTLNNAFMYPYWMSCGTGHISSTTVSTTSIPDGYDEFDEPHEPFSFDITKAVQSHLNFIRSGGYVGSYCYGYKLRAPNSRIFQAYSERSSSSSDWPYFEVTYVTNSNYEMANTPQKFNNIDSSSSSDPMYNFQKRMNCYAYALQVYYRSYTPSDTYYLNPGEFGIQETASLQYPMENYSDLMSYYDSFFNQMQAASTNTDKQLISKNYMNFIEEQMSKDASALSFSLTPFQQYSLYPVVDNDFELPNDFNSNAERIIAFVTYYKKEWNSVYSAYRYALDYHYYLRNGNGTCTDPTHDSNCSKWSHKMGAKEVKDSCSDIYGNVITLCDANIGDYACSIPSTDYTNNEVRYYRITKNTNIYNSWHGYGHNSNSTGTPYQP